MSLGRMGRTLRNVLAATLAAVLVLATTGVAAAQGGIPDGITEQSENVNLLWLVVLAMAVVIWAAVTGVLVYIVVRYRRRSDDDPLPKQIHGNTAIEFLWGAIPVVIVLVLFVVSFIVLLDIEDDAEPGSLTVEVTGFRWQWAFAYDLGDLGEPSSLAPAEGTVRILGAPDDEPVLYLPVDEEIEFVLLASDVIHSFYIRDFLYKLDVVPGRENKFRVVTTDEGTYRGQCAEFCGTDHALMRFSIEVVSRAEFDDWISRQATAQGLIESPESLLANAD